MARWQSNRTTATADNEREDEVTLVINDGTRSLSKARRFLGRQLAEAGLDHLVPDMELVASELITNALLHAGMPVHVRVRSSDHGARIEVCDPSPLLPVPTHEDRQAMTGRGLRLAQALSSAWGAVPNGDGKCVWAELTGRADPLPSSFGQVESDELIARWAGEEPEGDPASPLHRVRLGPVPVELLLTAKSHVDDLVREFTLATSGASNGLTGKVPAALAELIESVVHDFADPRQAIRRQAVTAQAEHHDHVTLELTLPASAADAAERYLRALDEADAYCRAARLLTLETPPQHRLFRHWYIGELVTQLRQAATGAPGRPGQTFEQYILREVDRLAGIERRETRAARLQELSFRLVGAATPVDVTHITLDTGAAALGAWGGVALLAAPGGEATVLATVGYDPRMVSQVRARAADADLPAMAVLRTGKPQWLESPESLAARFPAIAALEPATAAVAAVPLKVHDRTIGALRFSFPTLHLFDDDERNLIEAIAAQGAQALHRTQLAAARNDAASRLQRSLLPPALPNVPGVTISTAYRPLTADLEVGGDFYDVWPCDGDRLALAIGDVSGHGPEAAALTGLIRHTLRALTLTTSPAPEILRLLDRRLRETLSGTDRFATVAFAFLDHTPNSCRLDLAIAGHPAPVVLREEGSRELLGSTGSLLGILEEPEITTHRIVLAPGDELVLVTDGVTEARDPRGAWFEFDGVTTAARAAGPGRDTADAVTRAVLAHTDGRLHDDLAVLAIRCRGTQWRQPCR